MPIESLVDALENNKYADLKADFGSIIEKKIEAKVEEKKQEIINVLNGVVPTTEEETPPASTEDDSEKTE